MEVPGPSRGKGAPGGTTMTPAFLSYNQSFTSIKYGSGAAMAFIVFLIIVVLTWFQRRVMREDKKPSRWRRRSAVLADSGASGAASLAETTRGSRR